ncbi:glycosyltransferase family protein [Polynucleobacter necessarius]|uniref:hypothetical protein n=1 Tax=Polynucleobacter necessarius TaxID=576610 RepID=UPI000E096F04|nr:hypothetical protein [Polynucleobacter necessarius]
MTLNDKKPLKLIFAGVARDCEKYLPAVLRGIEALAEHYSDSAFIFVENDSSDSTKKVFGEWGEKRSNFYPINIDGLGAIPRRGLRLEIARASYVEFIKSDVQLISYDYLVVLDMDDVNTLGVNPQKFIEATTFLQERDERAAVFANQLGTYYDMWTFRHESLCPGDVWEEIFDCVQHSNLSDEEAYLKTFSPKILSLPPINEMLEVESAFGGFGIYKLSYVLKNKNPYLGSKVKISKDANGRRTLCRWEICEHVHFNLGIRNLGGKLFIKQDLINAANHGLSFPPSAYRNFIF